MLSPTAARAPLSWAIPAIVIMLLFHYAAFVAGGWYAFTDWNGLTRPNFVGLDNFRRVLTSEEARSALGNTLFLTVFYVTLSNAIGLGLAMLLNGSLRGRNALRVLFFAPVVMSPLAVSYVWKFIFAVNGPINAGLEGVGLDSATRVWLGDPDTAIWAVLVVMVWQFSGLCMAFYLAGLQGIPDEVLEAAEIDGASRWRRFRKIIFPLLAPAATVSIALPTIFGLRTFDQVIALTFGGPGYATETLATQIFKQTFGFGRFGYGAAFALVLTALVLVVSSIQLIVLRAREDRL
ncbi:carbohydrate ABC transporter permease [Mesobacterium pallidum]|uniref:carbohydrate ABC transporter permease n=1 Tax=Mesobacterium pallidum TaxID=2872037 RepID=UPI001EE29758|nr:sugar ABC transporter permease [Mesobacterium pallidum]